MCGWDGLIQPLNSHRPLGSRDPVTTAGAGFLYQARQRGVPGQGAYQTFRGEGSEKQDRQLGEMLEMAEKGSIGPLRARLLRHLDSAWRFTATPQAETSQQTKPGVREKEGSLSPGGEDLSWGSGPPRIDSSPLQNENLGCISLSIKER